MMGVRLKLSRSALMCALVLASPSEAAKWSQPEPFSITVPGDYDVVLGWVRDVCTDGLIHGTRQYDNESEITGAEAGGSPRVFPQWTGPGEVLYKERRKAVAPAHFQNSRDIGTITLRYVVEKAAADRTRISIQAVFVEDNRHGRHTSDGMVEMAEYAEIAKKLKQTGYKDARKPEAKTVAQK
jgi:hypothetical protein